MAKDKKARKAIARMLLAFSDGHVEVGGRRGKRARPVFIQYVTECGIYNALYGEDGPSSDQLNEYGESWP